MRRSKEAQPCIHAELRELCQDGRAVRLATSAGISGRVAAA